MTFGDQIRNLKDAEGFQPESIHEDQTAQAILDYSFSKK